MALRYRHLGSDDSPQSINAEPFRTILVAEMSVDEPRRNEVPQWLVKCGCLYFIAWGIDCEAWHDAVDWAVLEKFGYGEIPDDQFVMTTWHDKEPLSEAMWFAGNCAEHPDVELSDTVILHAAAVAQESMILRVYRESQELADDE